MATSSCSSSLALLLVVMVYAAAGAFAATTHEVGDDKRWEVPQSASAYTDWANKQTFTVGDSLLFNFPTRAHDVLQVNKASYDACNIQNPLAQYNTGPATVNLNSSGTHYYICGVGTHCSLGQKMTLSVSPASSTPTTPPPPPTSGGTTAPPPTSGGTTAPPPRNAAPSNGLGKAAIAAVALAASVAALVL